MKKTIIIIFNFFIGVNLIYSQGGWDSIYQNDSLRLTSVYFINETTGFVAGMRIPSFAAVILKTTNGGTTWENQEYGINAALFEINFINSSSGYTVGDNGNFYRTSNSGSNWFNVPLNLPDIYLRDVQFIDNNTGFIVGGYGGIIRKTTNSGASWLILDLNIQYINSSVNFFNANTGFIVSFRSTSDSLRGKILKTTNGGINWLNINYGGDFALHSMQFVNNNVGYIAGIQQVGINRINKILKSTDSGNNWVTTNIVDSALNERIYFLNENTGFLSANMGCIFKTTNGGQNWAKYRISTVNDFHEGIYFVNSNTGFCVGKGIYKTTNGGNPIGIHLLSNQSPNRFYLFQNYPNPFNPVTNFQFDVYKKGIVKLSIFDLLGKEIQNLLNDELQVGRYKLDWDAKSYPSGTYYYRLEAENYSESKKMILIK